MILPLAILHRRFLFGIERGHLGHQHSLALGGRLRKVVCLSRSLRSGINLPGWQPEPRQEGEKGERSAGQKYVVQRTAECTGHCVDEFRFLSGSSYRIDQSAWVV